MQRHALEFLVVHKPRYRACWEALVVLCIEKPPKDRRRPVRFSRNGSLTHPHTPARGFFTSCLFHFSVIFFLLRAPLFFFLQDGIPEARPPEIVYDLRPVDLSRYLPSLRSRGPGGKPGRGIRRDKPPARGSTAFDPRLTLVSAPLRPDNSRQTIIQPSSPPDLKIPFELRLPNVVAPGTLPAPKAPVDLGVEATVRAPSTNQAFSQAPVVPTQTSDFVIPPTPSVNPFPRLVVAVAPPLSSLEDLRVGPAAKRAALGSQGVMGNVGGLLILGVNPGPAMDSITVPPGNRYGVFSISPAGGRPGSPEGLPGGDPEGGTGGEGTGGDASTGVGPGDSGGGSGAGTGAPLNINGGGEEGALSSSIPAGLVYPIPSPPPNLRRGSLVVTTGPIGGGGLQVYGVLRGGKIYTIYLPMPGKNWILQYCRRSPSSPKRSARSRGFVIHLDHGLVPPQAEKKFDFRRPPIPDDKADDMVILYGVIRTDGRVDELRILQSVQADVDQVAVAAFGRWRFKPALQVGKPVTVEILLGIPARVPTKEVRTAETSRDPVGN